MTELQQGFESKSPQDSNPFLTVYSDFEQLSPQSFVDL